MWLGWEVLDRVLPPEKAPRPPASGRVLEKNRDLVPGAEQRKKHSGPEGMRSAKA